MMLATSLFVFYFTYRVTTALTLTLTPQPPHPQHTRTQKTHPFKYSNELKVGRPAADALSLLALWQHLPPTWKTGLTRPTVSRCVSYVKMSVLIGRGRVRARCGTQHAGCRRVCGRCTISVIWIWIRIWICKRECDGSRTSFGWKVKGKVSFTHGWRHGDPETAS